MTKTLRFILGDQLSRSVSSLEGIDPDSDIVLMVEVLEEATYVKHHQQKLALFFSAMRHFARDLESQGFSVDYVPMDDPANTGSFTSELERAIDRHQPDQVVITEPGEWRVYEKMNSWQQQFGIDVEIREDSRYLSSISEFESWASGRKSLRMEFFYRIMRRKTGWLMEGDQPVGGQWNYDKQNRKSLPKNQVLPQRLRFERDEITRQVMEMVSERFSDHFGQLDNFAWATTREDAQSALTHFINECLPGFGDYQDAMKEGEDFNYHSLVSPYLNIGLLTADEVCLAAVSAYENNRAPLAAVEGFVRQILGWREYVRGLYWLKMPGYAETNHLEAERPLPEFFWTAETDMNCMREAIDATRRNAYAHHIQRLMVTGNFALLAGLSPREVEEWYLLVYADALEWVELPNTHGMALFADGGVIASKPYAASGAYINRMSDYCKNCRFSPKDRVGDGACPFNYLYWNFLKKNENRLGSNPRMSLAYRNLANRPADELELMIKQSEDFLESI